MPQQPRQRQESRLNREIVNQVRAYSDEKYKRIQTVFVQLYMPMSYYNNYSIIDSAVKQFAKGEYAEGIADAVTAVGEVLKQHFPYRDDDINELPDEISFGDD